MTADDASPIRNVKVVGTIDSRYLAPHGSQNLQARIKWFTRYRAFAQGPWLATCWITDSHFGVYSSQTVSWAIIGLLTFPDLYMHRHCTSDKSQQAILDFNNHATKLSHYMLRKVKHDRFRDKIIQTTSRFDRKQKCLRACATEIHQSCMSFSVTNSRVTFQITLISTFPTK